MINILLTDGEFTGMIKALRDFDSELRITGFCSSEYCAHAVLLDACYIAPDHKDKGYYSFLTNVINKEHVDYIFPVGTLTLEYYAENAKRIHNDTGAMVITSDSQTIATMNNKALLYRSLSSDPKLAGLIPEYRLAQTIGELKNAVSYFDRKGIPCASKPVRGENAEGFFRFVNASEYARKLLEGSASHLCTIDAFSKESDDTPLPAMRLIMPFLTGREWDADILSLNGKLIALTVRENKDMFGGLSACTVTTINDAVCEAVKEIIAYFGYSYLANISFKEDEQGRLYLLEINPRAMGSISVSSLAGNSLVKKLFGILKGSYDPLAAPQITKPGLTASLYYDHIQVPSTQWNTLKASDCAVYEEYYAKTDTLITDYSFPCRFAWDELFRIRWSIIEDCLVQFSLGEISGFPFMLMPMGDYDESKLRRIFAEVHREFNRNNVPFRIACIDEKYLGIYQKVCDSDIFFKEDYSDYLYEAESLRTLAGRSLSKKRNHLSQFMRKYPDFRYVKLSGDIFEECLELIKLWAKEKEVDINDMDNSDYLMIKRVFDNWDLLKVRGGAVIIDGHVRAFSIGSLGNKDTAFIHFEKADTAYDGAYAAINKMVLQNEFADAKFVNREEDLGIPGLRQSKESYFPIKKLRKYRTL